MFAAMLGGTTSRGRQHECGVRSTLDHPETVPLRVHRLDHITVKYRQYWEKLGNKMNESTSVTSTLQIHDLSDGSATVHDEYSLHCFIGLLSAKGSHQGLLRGDRTARVRQAHLGSALRKYCVCLPA